MSDKKSHKTENASESSVTDELGESVTAMSTVDRKQKITKNVKYWVALNIGILFMAFGVYMFEGPNNFLMGGVSGIAIFLERVITPYVGWLTYDVFMWVINGILLIIGFIFLGKGVGLKTVYCTVMYTVEIFIFNLIYKPTGPITGETGLLEAIFAVIVVGVGQAIIFYCGATSGGTDIIALIVKKYKKINISFAIIAVDFVIAALAFVSFFDPDFGPKMGLLCILGVTLRAFAIDGIIENIAKTKHVTIVTSNPEIVANIIVNDLNRGYTKYKAEGGFTGEERTIIMTVCQRAQAIRLKEKVSKEDPTAFTIITDANEILGKGFAKKF